MQRDTRIAAGVACFATVGIALLIITAPSIQASHSGWWAGYNVDKTSVDQDEIIKVDLDLESHDWNPGPNTHFTVSFSDHLTLHDDGLSSSERVHKTPGDTIHDCDSSFPASYELVEGYHDLDHSDSWSPWVDLRAEKSGSAWIKIRFAFHTSQDPDDWDCSSFSRGPNSGWDCTIEEDQQGFQACRVDVDVKEPPDPPEPRITDFSAPSSIDLGESATIRLDGTNQGGEAQWESLHMSFPENPDSSNVEVSGHDLDSATVIPPGSELGYSYGESTITSDYIVVEGENTPWGNGDDEYLEVTVTPEELGTFEVYYKSVAQDHNGDFDYYTPRSGTTDQQDEYVYVHTIDVESPDPEITGFQAPNEISLGDSATIRIDGTNTGSDAKWQSLHLSFPDNPSSSNVDITDHTLETAEILTPGSEAGYNYGESTTTTDYILVEGWNTPWQAGDDEYLEASVTPEQAGSFEVYYKSVAEDYDGNFDYYVPTSGTQDQQSEYVNVHTIDVKDSDARITNFDAPSGSKQPGDTLEASTTVENTGDTTRSVWVGLSYRRPDDEFYDIDPKETVTLSPGETDQVSFSWSLPDDAPEGSYDAVTAIWNDYDSSNDEMVTPKYDETSVQDAFTVESETQAPDPTVSSNLGSFDLEVGEERTITFTVDNTGGPATQYSHITLSVSSNLDIVDWDPTFDYSDWGRHEGPGATINNCDGELTSENELLEGYAAFDAAETISTDITFRAVDDVDQEDWIRYRASLAKDESWDCSNFVRNPEGGETDQQGFYVKRADVHIQPADGPAVVSQTPSQKKLEVDKESSEEFTVAVRDPDGDLGDIDWYFSDADCNPVEGSVEKIGDNKWEAAVSHSFEQTGEIDVGAIVSDEGGLQDGSCGGWQSQAQILWTVSVGEHTEVEVQVPPGWRFVDKDDSQEVIVSGTTFKAYQVQNWTNDNFGWLVVDDQGEALEPGETLKKAAFTAEIRHQHGGYSNSDIENLESLSDNLERINWLVDLGNAFAWIRDVAASALGAIGVSVASGGTTGPAAAKTVVGEVAGSLMEEVIVQGGGCLVAPQELKSCIDNRAERRILRGADRLDDAATLLKNDPQSLRRYSQARSFLNDVRYGQEDGLAAAMVRQANMPSADLTSQLESVATNAAFGATGDMLPDDVATRLALTTRIAEEVRDHPDYREAAEWRRQVSKIHARSYGKPVQTSMWASQAARGAPNQPLGDGPRVVAKEGDKEAFLFETASWGAKAKDTDGDLRKVVWNVDGGEPERTSIVYGDNATTRFKWRFHEEGSHRVTLKILDSNDAFNLPDPPVAKETWSVEITGLSKEKMHSLAGRYAPVMYLHSQEEASPTPVNEFLDGAVLVDGNSYDLDDEGAPLLDASPDSYLTAAPDEGGSSIDEVSKHRIYTRVAQLDSGKIALQYWTFFSRDEKHLGPIENFNQFSHEGDWSVFQVLLNKDQEPIGAAISQHYVGEERSWDQVPTETYSGVAHPAVYIARGSHALFFRPGYHDYLRPGDYFVALDEANPGQRLTPGDGYQLVQLTTPDKEGQPWLSYPGRWGRTSRDITGILDGSSERPKFSVSPSPRGPRFAVSGPGWTDAEKHRPWRAPIPWMDSLYDRLFLDVETQDDGSTVSVTVRVTANGEPVPGIPIRVEGCSFVDADGWFDGPKKTTSDGIVEGRLETEECLHRVRFTTPVGMGSHFLPAPPKTVRVGDQTTDPPEWSTYFTSDGGVDRDDVEEASNLWAESQSVPGTNHMLTASDLTALNCMRLREVWCS